MDFYAVGKNTRQVEIAQIKINGDEMIVSENHEAVGGSYFQVEDVKTLEKCRSAPVVKPIQPPTY